MIDLTKAEKRASRELIRKGILRRHAEWLAEMRELLNKPLGDDGNEFDRSMKITKASHQFFKEAMSMERYYDNPRLALGLSVLYSDGYITDEDVDTLPEKVARWVKSIHDPDEE